jgi:tetratricopeptide (TPR) repeat protein
MGECFAAGRDVDAHAAMNVFAVQSAALRMVQGRYAEIESSLKALAQEQPAVPAWRCSLAYLYCEAGRDQEARAEIDRLAPNGFASLPRDVLWVAAAAQVAEACGRLGDKDRAAVLYEQLMPHAKRCVVVEYGIACLGSTSRHLGILAAALGRWNDAESHFQDAVETHRRMGALPWLARTQDQYGHMLLARDRGGDAERAAALIAGAAASYRQLEMTGFALRFAAQPMDPLGGAGGGRAPLFRNEGGSWLIAYAGESFRLAPMRGLAYIAQLLANPGAEIGAAQLFADAGGKSPASAEACRVAVTKAIALALRRIGEHSPALRNHFEAALSTGRRCRYVPPGGSERWSL